MRDLNYSSDESEVSDSSVNNRSFFRVSVCLRRYFQDHRSRCYMLVPRWRRVRWLESRIKKVFSITDELYLCSDGHMLPSSEPLALLAPGETIQVIPLKEEKNSDNMISGRTKGQTIYDIASPKAVTDSTQEYHLTDEDIDRISEEVAHNNHSHSYNSRRDNNNSPHSKETEPSETFSSLHNDMEVIKHNISDEADGTLDTLQQMKQQALMLLQNESELKRRARRRVRRRKRTSRGGSPRPAPSALRPLIAPVPSPVPVTPHIRFPSSPPSPLPLPRPPTTSVPVTPHIRFPSSPPSALPRSSSPSLDVERNESVTSRPPRVIGPLAVG